MATPMGTTRVHHTLTDTARVLDFDDENDDIRGVVEDLGLPALEVGTLYHLMGIETAYRRFFDIPDTSLPVDARNKRSRILTWGRVFINGETTVGFDAWFPDFRVNGSEGDGNVYNVETPERARQTFRNTYGLSILPKPTEESQWIAVVALLVLGGAGLAYLLYRRK